jgi:hypothetical protein
VCTFQVDIEVVSQRSGQPRRTGLGSPAPDDVTKGTPVDHPCRDMQRDGRRPIGSRDATNAVEGLIVDSIRTVMGRPVVPILLVALAALVAGCAQVGTATFGFWDVIWSMIAFFFWVMLIWIFIAIFGDIFRRNDLSGGMKAVWIIVLVLLPFLGALIYMVARPKVTAQDVELMTQADAAAKAAASVSPADQIAKLQELKAAGAITEPEYEALKAKAIG